MIHDPRTRHRADRPASEHPDNPHALPVGMAIWLGLFGLALYLIFR